MKISAKKFFLLFVSILLINLVLCTPARNYRSPHGPKFSGSFVQSVPSIKDSIKVISFNLKFSRQIKQAIKEFRNFSDLHGADIILLQEMDESGTDSIAKILHYNYIYFPATLHPQSHRNFGNSILSKWPLTEEKKIILPFEPAIGRTQRIAVGATVIVNDYKIRIYSTHLATVVLSEEKRLLQADSLLKSIPEDYKYVIVGGDFNSVFAKNIRDIEEIFQANHFYRASKNAGYTVKKGPFELTLDHLFVKNFKTLNAGTHSTEASDHRPLWVILKPES
jgi:endonuclease/exonuclease/phosphatase family metal-dependent hydrolase